MKNLQLIIFILYCNTIFAHTVNYENQVLRHWNVQQEHQFVDGSFYMFKNGKVYIEDANNAVIHFQLSALSKEDQQYTLQREAKVEVINAAYTNQNSLENQTVLNYKLVFIGLFLLLFTIILFKYADKNKRKYALPIVYCGVLMTLFSFAKNTLSTTDRKSTR